MAKIKNTYTRLIAIANVEIPVGEERNVPGYKDVKDGPVIKSWLAGGVFTVTATEDDVDLLLPPVPVAETDIEKMKVDELRAFLTKNNVAFSNEQKPELLELARLVPPAQQQ